MMGVLDWVGQFLNWVGLVSTILWLFAIVAGIWVWAKGILPAVIRLGNGFAKRKIAIFANAHMESMNNLLEDSKLFKKKNIIKISSQDDFGRAGQADIYLVCWPDWPPNVILELVKSVQYDDRTALVVYAPPKEELPNKGFIPQNIVEEINKKKSAAISNHRGRLLGDIVACLITTGFA